MPSGMVVANANSAQACAASCAINQKAYGWMKDYRRRHVSEVRQRMRELPVQWEKRLMKFGRDVEQVDEFKDVGTFGLNTGMST